jgi:hypothetical protein
MSAVLVAALRRGVAGAEADAAMYHARRLGRAVAAQDETPAPAAYDVQ